VLDDDDDYGGALVMAALKAQPLTRRENEVLWLLDARLSHEEIAAVLHIPPEMVETHARSIHQKLRGGR
jgi:DNA-binding CsgD family transcriptional regulator